VLPPDAEGSEPGVGPPPQPLPLEEGAVERLRVFGDLLAGEGVVRGLIGPREVGRLWDRHLLNCLAAAELAPPGSRVLDLGSGAGLPGVVWAVARPDLAVELVEPLLRRATWLKEVVEVLGLRDTVVTRARAEDLHGKRAVDLVTARAVAPLDRLAGSALPLLRPGGALLALKGSSAVEELEQSRAALARLGTEEAAVLQSGAGWARQPTTVVRVVAGTGRQESRPGASGVRVRGPRAGRTRRR
jgi:16S rRNA (guanine527-N7)-methyltransferase